MLESKPIEDAGRKLFGELFGFKKGDRIKEWRVNRHRYWSRSPKGYWKYGTVTRIVLDAWGGKRYRIYWDGECRTELRSASQLIKVRPYVRRKIKGKKSMV